MKRIMIIAGSDSGGGAGIQADLKTATSLGVFGTTVITAVTAQNTVGVRKIYGLPPDLVEAQIDAVMEDIGTDGVKTGMLFSSDIIRTVAERAVHYRWEIMIVDPVMVSKSGHRLLEEDAISSVKSYLIPLATVVTPNIFEAEVLSGIEIRSIDDMRRAARKIVDMGAKGVVVKGGHMSGDPIDLLLWNGEFYEFVGRRIETANTHGTGCTFASAIASFIIKGKSVPDAVSLSKQYIERALSNPYNIGKGKGPVNPLPIKEPVME